MNYKGTRWYKTDLHIHTPASKCFENKDVSPTQWVQRCIEQGLEVVAVTDHNTGAYIDKIKEAAEGTNLIIFPGVEVTCSDSKVHLLIIFDRDKTTQDIEDFLLSIHIPREEFASPEAYAPHLTIEIIRKADEKGGIVIPAHIDEYNGLCEISYQSREDIFSLPCISAVHAVHEVFTKANPTNDEIKQNLSTYYNREISEEKYKTWKVSANSAACYKKSILTFSDNPNELGGSKHGLWGIGQRFTWLKMDEEINLESLRQAFLLPQYRVKNDFAYQTHPFTPPDSWIKKLTITDTELNPEKTIEVNFSPQMTAIIGGRGTGKSSLLRIIRGIFGKTDDLDSFPKLIQEQNDFYRLKQNEQGILKKESIVEMTVVRYNQKYNIKVSDFSQNGQQKISIAKWNKEKDIFENHNDTSIMDVFSFDIFSQKQIYEIAQKPNALRNRIDHSIKEISILNESISSLRSQYFEQSAMLRRMENYVERKKRLIFDINDKKEQISTFKESGFEDLIEEYKLFNQQNEELKLLQTQLRDKEETLFPILSKLDLTEKPKVNSISASYQPEIEKIISSVFEEYSEVQSLIKDAHSRIMELQLNYDKKIELTKWTMKYNEVKNDFIAKKNELMKEGIDDLSKLEEITREISSLENDLKKINLIEERIPNEKVKKEKLKDEIIIKRKNITDIRKRFLDEVISNGANIKIELKPFRDQQSFITYFREIIQKKSAFDDDVKKIVQKCFQGFDVISNISHEISHFKELKKIYANKSSVRIEKDELLATWLEEPRVETYLGARMVNVINGLNEEQIDELDLLLPEDEIVVKYKTNGSSTFKLLSNASAGQKTSAILTFLLSFGDAPLILDQPEDDLDNHLINELIVEGLKQSKEKRQIITVTHNANIPVNGDAEWIVCMDSGSSNLKILCAGSVEDDTIKKEICDVMEGGKDAFKLRARRYNLS